MISHSFELEPLGRHEEKLKYAPCFSRIPRDAAEEKVCNPLSPQDEERAQQAYRKFITNLLKHPSINITTILHENPQLKNELENEANSLIQWWKNS